MLIVLGVLFVILGVVLSLGRHLPFLGHLPGDFSFERKGVHIIFPLATCLVLSIVVTVVLNLIFRR